MIDKAVLIASVVSGVLLHAVCPFARDIVAVRARESRLQVAVEDVLLQQRP